MSVVKFLNCRQRAYVLVVVWQRTNESRVTANPSTGGGLRPWGARETSCTRSSETRIRCPVLTVSDGLLTHTAYLEWNNTDGNIPLQEVSLQVSRTAMARKIKYLGEHHATDFCRQVSPLSFSFALRTMCAPIPDNLCDGMQPGTWLPQIS